MNALVIAAHDGQLLDPATASVVAAAQQLVTPGIGLIDVLLVGHGTTAVMEQATALAGVNEVLYVKDVELVALNAETLARQVADVSASYTWLLASHSRAARSALPRAAALLGAAYLSDIVRINDGVVERPAYAGAVSTRVRSTGQTFLTVRASAFAASAPGLVAAKIRLVHAVSPDTRTQRIGQEGVSTNRPDLSRARIVVAGGRGVGSAENMAKVEALADHLGAAVGASRAAVDAGFASNAVQIGQTGKTIAPEIYIALGISGAIQHLAGIKDAKCIVAVNKDPDAPIFQIADFGVVGDLFEALPALQSLPAAASA